MNIKVLDIVGDRATDMKQGDQIYELNFDGMVTILSTFLNNAIGTLYQDYTSDFLNANLQILNMNGDDKFILRRVIKRAKEFYANEKEITNVLNDKLSD